MEMQMDAQIKKSFFSFHLSSDASRLIVVAQLRLLLFFLGLTILICLAIVKSGRASWHYPNDASIYFVTKHYVHTIVWSMLVATLVVGFRVKHTLVPNLVLLIFSLTLFVIVLFLHFNLKTWAHQLNPQNYDELYHSVDIQFEWLRVFLTETGRLMRRLLIHISPNPYHDVFVALFFLTFLLAAVDRQPEGRVISLLTATALVLLLGGMLYSMAPAFGPFIYGGAEDVATRDAQLYMMRYTNDYIASGGASYSPEYFVAALGAMPSLHVANTFVFCWFAYRYCHRAWLMLYVPMFIYISSDAIALRWHYLVDIPAGITLAMLAVWLVGNISTNSSNFFSLDAPDPKMQSTEK